MTTQHTPFKIESAEHPDYLDGIRCRYSVEDNAGQIIAYVRDYGQAELEREIAAFIVRAANAHEELVEALRELIAHVDGVNPERGTNSPMMLKARAALAAAEAK